MAGGGGGGSACVVGSRGDGKGEGDDVIGVVENGDGAAPRYELGEAKGGPVGRGADDPSSKTYAMGPHIRQCRSTMCVIRFASSENMSGAGLNVLL
jgi:hypothetical protein